MYKDVDIPVGYAESIQRKSELVPNEQLEQIRTLARQIAAINGLAWVHGFTLTNNRLMVRIPATIFPLEILD